MMRSAVDKGKLLQSFRRGSTRYRDYVSVNGLFVESPPSGGMKKIGETVIGIFYPVAFGGFGCVLGALASNHLVNDLHNHVKRLVEMRKELDEKLVSTLPEKLQRFDEKD